MSRCGVMTVSPGGCVVHTLKVEEKAIFYFFNLLFTVLVRTKKKVENISAHNPKFWLSVFQVFRFFFN